MPKNKTLISVIILNWNRPNDTIKCIASVKKQTYKNYEIIVVDNGSADNSMQLLSKIKDIKLIPNPVNRGFTGGHIDGLQHANGDFIFVLNNDAVIDPNYIKNALDILKTDDKIAVVGGRSYQWESEEQVFNDKVPFFAFQNINRPSMEGIFERSDGGYTHETNWVSGSAMIIRKSAIDRVGYLFDPMFAYYEECDLFARMQAHDYKIVYSPLLKIWHKNGASSSSFFQLNQLFKNRFIYALRNLKADELARFIKSYSKTTLRGSYHYILHKNSDENSQIMNKALHSALLSSLSTWPRWLVSRKNILRLDSNGYSLLDRLKIEQTGISFVCDLSQNVKLFSNLVEFIKNITYKHYNSEIIIVCNKENKKSLLKLIEDSGVDNLNVRISVNNNKIKTNPINLGWLSASKKYVWFISANYRPNIETVYESCLNIPDGEYGMYVESAHKPTKNPSLITQLNNNICLSRSLLSLYGGIDSEDTSLSLSRIYYFAVKLNSLCVYSKQVPETGSITEHSVDSKTSAKIRLITYNYHTQNVKNNSYNKLLEKYYRLYQINNISQWLFIGEIPTRLKLARTKNCIIASIKLNRKNLAIELKHISNEVVKARHSGFDKGVRETELSNKAMSQIKTGGWKNTPIFVICRDRLSPLKMLIEWLEKADMKNIILVDNASIYPPLVEYLSNTPYQVIATNKNIGHTVVWKEGFAKTLFPGEYYIVTDPDVIPDDEAPLDSVKYFYTLHNKYIDHQKVGFGLQVHDLPEYYTLKSHVIEWEKQFWKNELEDGVFEAGIDTTFALYKPYTDNYFLNPSIRTGKPYTAKHLPWYTDNSKIDKEEEFYRLHANQSITSWNSNELMSRYAKEMKK